MAFVQVCPVQPIDSVCPEPLIWIEVASSLPLTYGEFIQIVPHCVAVLLTAWGFKQLVMRMVFNK